MSRVNTYLNFQGQAGEAFTFYAKIFGTEITMLSRFSDMPAAGPGELPADERDLVMHAELPILAGHVLMATDMLRSMGHETRIGNNTTVCLGLRQQAGGRPYLRRPLGGRVEGLPDGRPALGRLLGRHPRPLRHPLDGQLRPGLSPRLRSGIDQARVFTLVHASTRSSRLRSGAGDLYDHDGDVISRNPGLKVDDLCHESGGQVARGNSPAFLEGG
jgi:PhnB protein